MKTLRNLALLIAFSAAPLLAAEPLADTWPGFRGTGQSVTRARNLPLSWSPTENVAWQADLPGYGQSSPVIWKDRVFVTYIDGPRQTRLLTTALDLAKGTVLWTQEAEGSQGVEPTDYVAKAAPTPVVDSRALYTLFETGDLLAYGHDGKLLWQRSLVKEYGPIKTNHGIGSSPVLVNGTLFALMAHEGGSYLLAVDPADGKTRWKAEVSFTTTWSTPAPVEIGGRKLLLVNTGKSLQALDPESGKALWNIDGFKGNTVPSPSVSGEWVVVGSSDRGNTAGLKLRDGAPAEVAWRAPEISSAFASPLVHEGLVYGVNRAGVSFCVDLKSGQTQWEKRLPASCWASPLAAGDRVYFFSLDGSTTVVRANPKLEVLAENKIPVEGRIYGLAAVDGALVYRSGKRVVRVGVPSQ